MPQDKHQGEQQADGVGMDMPAGGNDLTDMPATPQHTLAALQDLGLNSGSTSGQHAPPSAQPAFPSPPGTPAYQGAGATKCSTLWGKRLVSLTFTQPEPSSATGSGISALTPLVTSPFSRAVEALLLPARWALTT